MLRHRRKDLVHESSVLDHSQADADSGKSTVEDQLHEAEANKNASAFVKAQSYLSPWSLHLRDFTLLQA